MSGDPSSDTDNGLTGWDTSAFWVPSLDFQGALLLVTILLVILHMDEIFGLHSSASLIFGWLPVNFGYHFIISLLHVLFLLLLYHQWPVFNRESDQQISAANTMTKDDES